MNDQTAATSHLQRRLGPMERSVWIFDQASPFNMGCAVDLSGDIREDDLRQVLRHCQIRYAMLRSLVLNERGKLHFACFAPEDAPSIPLEVVIAEEGDRDKIASAELRRRFDTAHDLMIRAKLVKLSNGVSSLFLTFHHLIGDGASAANLMVDVVESLGELAAGKPLSPANALPFPPALEACIDPGFRGWRGLLRMVGTQAQTNKRMKAAGDMPSPLRNDAQVPFAERMPAVQTITFDANETSALIERTKQEGVTLYALLCAVTLEAIFPLLAESKKNPKAEDRVITMPVPANMRPFLSQPVKNNFGFFASTVDVVCKLTGRDDLFQMARTLRTDIKTAMRKDSGRLYVMPAVASIMDWKLFFPNSPKGVDRAGRFVAGMAKYSSTSISFLNLQRLPRTAGPLRITNARGYLAPSIVGTALFSAVLHNDVLNVHLSYNEKQFLQADASLLLERFRKIALRVTEEANSRRAGR